MATKTLILRPVSMDYLAWSAYPSTTDYADFYRLINEEIADDDATYIHTVSTTMNGKINYDKNGVDVTPKAIRVIVRAWTDGTARYLTISQLNNVNTTLVDKIPLLAGSTNYETYKIDIPSQCYTDFWDIDDSSELSVSLQFPSDNDKSNDTVRVTQVYLEVDYDDGTGADPIPVIYHKASNAWKPVYGTVYKKIDGMWVEGTLDGLADGDSVTVVEV